MRAVIPHAARGWRLLTAGAAAWLGLTSGYLLLLLGLGRRPLRAHTAGPAAGLRVAVLVPAHDEAAGIGPTLASLRVQDHPASRLEVIVIADNCADDTAGVAAAAGVTVWERDAPDAPGKGQALAWALERLWRERAGTEAVVVVDADCIADPGLCGALVAPIAAGEADATQARYEVSNAAEAPAAALRAAGFALKHVIRARGRARLGLSCGLFGTGMAFSRRLLQTVPWPGSVTEDTELFVRIVRSGLRIAYVETARVTSAMPASAEAAREQQLRWETGNAELARTELRRLTWTALTTGRRDAWGAALELALPSQTLLATGSLVLALEGALRGRRRLTASALATLGAQTVYVAGGLRSAGGSQLTTEALAHVPEFAAGRLRTLARVGRGGGAREWVRTDRDASTTAGAPQHD